MLLGILPRLERPQCVQGQDSHPQEAQEVAQAVDLIVLAVPSFAVAVPSVPFAVFAGLLPYTSVNPVSPS